jgi:hypothetical protein
MEDKKHFFLVSLSYVHDDLKRIRKVYEGLKKRKLDVWFDKENLGTGKWKENLKKYLSVVILFFCKAKHQLL